jgi:hypothetical protein
MNKILFKISLGFFAVFLFTGTSFAANATSIRLQQPESPTNLNSFKITFVTLDTNPNQPVNVQCYKKGPTDAGFVSFGSVINLTNGGNTNYCQTDGGIMNQGAGTYTFEAIASGSNNATSNVVSVNFSNTNGPAAPEGYNKTKPDNCTYKITFKSGNDSGKTVKVVLYRSDQASFNVDSGHQVNSIDIGSNTDGSMTDNISPNCGTTYYYAIRAFDIYGNGSDLRGDSTSSTTVINPTATQNQDAIPVIEEGSTAGLESEKGVLSATKSAQEEITKEALGAKSQTLSSWIMAHKFTSFLVLLVIAAIVYAFVFFLKKRVK